MEKNHLPSSSPSFTAIQFSWPWRIIKPRVYRYMDNKYVEDFFKDGSLRISSFKKFAEHPDEKLRDENEGSGVRLLTGSEATVLTVQARGLDCYVLCGSTLNTKSTINKWKASNANNGCLVIDNTMAFSYAVSSHIMGFKGGYEGLAIYQDGTTILKHIESLKGSDLLETYRRPDGSMDMKMMFDLGQAAGGIEEVFLKHSSHADESEYRILWSTSQSLEDYIDIKVPEARQFCRHIDPENLGTSM